MSLKETLRSIQKAFLREIIPTKMPEHPNKPVFYTKEQELAMDWEAHMMAIAIHRVERHSSIPSLHAKNLHEMHEKFYANPEESLKNIMMSYRACMAIKNGKEQQKFEENYVAQKVANYRRMQSQIIGQGR